MNVILKSGILIVLPSIHNQNKKCPAHYSWGIYQEKLATKFSKVSWWALWVGDPRNFPNSLFFQVMQNAHFKNLLKKDASYLKIPWHSRRQKKILRKRETEHEKWEKVKQQQIFFFTFTFFLLLKIYILLVYILLV